MGQTSDEMLIEILNGTGRGTERVTIGALKACAVAVGTNSEQRLRWCLDFANAKLEEFTPGHLYNKRIELAAFRSQLGLIFANMKSAADFGKTIPLNSALFVSEEEVTRVHGHFNSLLTSFLIGGELSFVYEGKTAVTLVSVDDDWHFAQAPQEPIADFMVKFTKLIGEFGAYVRICEPQKHGCGKWFLAGRIDKVYCSDPCQDRASYMNRQSRLERASQEKQKQSRTAKLTPKTGGKKRGKK